MRYMKIEILEFECSNLVELMQELRDCADSSAFEAGDFDDYILEDLDDGLLIFRRNSEE